MLSRLYCSKSKLLSIILKYVINLILPKVLHRFISCSKLKLYIYLAFFWFSACVLRLNTRHCVPVASSCSVLSCTGFTKCVNNNRASILGYIGAQLRNVWAPVSEHSPWRAQSISGCSLRHSCSPRDSGGPSSWCSVYTHCGHTHIQNKDENYRQAGRLLWGVFNFCQRKSKHNHMLTLRDGRDWNWLLSIMVSVCVCVCLFECVWQPTIYPLPKQKVTLSPT